MAEDLCFAYGSYVDELATVAAFGELYGAVHEGVESVVFAHAYVEARVVYGATLTFDDVTGFAVLTTENLYSESFAF